MGLDPRIKKKRVTSKAVKKSDSLSTLTKRLQRRCSDAEIKLEPIMNEETQSGWAVHLPRGRDTQKVALFERSELVRFLDTDFEHVCFLGDYQATCSYETCTIEAAVHVLRTGTMLPVGVQLRELLGSSHGDDPEAGGLGTIEVAHGSSPEITAQLGPVTPEFEVLTGRRYRRVAHRGVSLRLRGFAVERHDQALDTLKRFADSLFFQIDLSHRIPLGLSKERTPSLRRFRRTLDPVQLLFPDHEYDSAPIALYWYARSAQGLPLLRFLALYQSLEYYFPVAVNAEAMRRVRLALKSPTFRSDRDTDVSKVIDAARPSGNRPGQSERAQLEAVLKEFVNADELRAFIRADEQRARSLSSKIDRVTTHKVSAESDNMLSELARRLYDIRCKVVHTKGVEDAEVELLLPGSREAAMIESDTDVLEFVAQRVLIATSTPT